jgi:hypothetical protein
MHSCVLSTYGIITSSSTTVHLPGLGRTYHMWLVSWLAAPHMRLDLAVEDPNAKNIIFLSAQLLCGLHLHSMF